MKFVQTPVEIDAIQFLGYNAAEVAAFVGPIWRSFNTRSMTLDTADGRLTVVPGEWIVLGPGDGVMKQRPEIFAMSHEAVE